MCVQRFCFNEVGKIRDHETALVKAKGKPLKLVLCAPVFPSPSFSYPCQPGVKTVTEENPDLQWDAVLCSRSHSADEGEAPAPARAFSTLPFEQFLHFFRIKPM